MSKVTSKYQVTLPKVIAEMYNIHPGDEIDWVPAGEVIRVIPPGRRIAAQNRELQLHLFDQATERHRRRQSGNKVIRPRDRGWRRDDLYARGRSD
jgi:AbrB family looped-hinge helix DNA binding protein